MSGFTVQKCGFCERKMFRKNKRQFRVMSLTPVIKRDAHRYREETLI